MTPNRDLAVAVLPAYNEAGTIRRVVDAVTPHVGRVIVVDDGSTDGTAAALCGTPAECLRDEHNQGKGHALRHGFRRALELGANTIITLDGDGQHPPERVPALLAEHELDPGAIVIAARRQRRADAPALRRAANRVADFFISWAAGACLLDTQSGFRLYPRAVAEAGLACTAEGFVFECGILIAAVTQGCPVRYVAIPALYPDTARASHYRPIADTLRITRHVGRRILRSGASPRRLARSLHTSRQHG